MRKLLLLTTFLIVTTAQQESPNNTFLMKKIIDNITVKNGKVSIEPTNFEISLALTKEDQKIPQKPWGHLTHLMNQLKSALDDRNIDKANNISEQLIKDKVEGISGNISFSVGADKDTEKPTQKETCDNTRLVTFTVEKKDLDTRT